VLATLAALALIPVQLALLPLAGFFQDGWQFGSIWLIPPTGLGSSYLPMWCAHAVLLLPLTILVLLAAMPRIPRDVMDQARLDGAGHALILWRIVLPTLRPAVASLFLVLFILTWNDLLIALVFAGGSTQVTPVTAYLALFMTSGRSAAIPGECCRGRRDGDPPGPLRTGSVGPASGNPGCGLRRRLLAVGGFRACAGKRIGTVSKPQGSRWEVDMSRDDDRGGHWSPWLPGRPRSRQWARGDRDPGVVGMVPHIRDVGASAGR
jgi:hypothetical protein